MVLAEGRRGAPVAFVLGGGKGQASFAYIGMLDFFGSDVDLRAIRSTFEGRGSQFDKQV